jgi:hypothetical protein
MEGKICFVRSRGILLGHIREILAQQPPLLVWVEDDASNHYPRFFLGVGKTRSVKIDHAHDTIPSQGMAAKTKDRPAI